MTNRKTSSTSNTYTYFFEDTANLGGRSTISVSIEFNSTVLLNFNHNNQTVIDCFSMILLCYVSSDCLQTAAETSILQTLLLFPTERLYDLDF